MLGTIIFCNFVTKRYTILAKKHNTKQTDQKVHNIKDLIHHTQRHQGVLAFKLNLYSITFFIPPERSSWHKCIIPCTACEEWARKTRPKFNTFPAEWQDVRPKQPLPDLPPVLLLMVATPLPVFQNLQQKTLPISLFSSSQFCIFKRNKKKKKS